MHQPRRWIPGLSVCCLLLAAQTGSATVPVMAVAAARAGSAVLDEAALANRIDQFVAERYTEKGVTPAPLADDAEFLRRVYLDLIGRIPKVSEVRDFLDDKAPNRRRRVVDRLLESPYHVKYFGAVWTNIIIPPGGNQQQAAAAAQLRPWLESQVRGNVPYDQMVRSLITAGVGLNNANNLRPVQLLQPGGNGSPLAFVQANEFKPENLAGATSRTFLGVRLECAQCHDHPFTDWKKKQFWEFAAFFAGAQRNNGRRIVNGRLVQQPQIDRFPRTLRMPGEDGKVVEARYLDKSAPTWQDKVDSRVTLADWVSSPKNPYFSRTGANRLWAHFLGVGINDPVDDEPTDENPISHPKLLQELSRQFVAHEFDVKYLIRAITASKTYQRTSARTHKSQDNPRLFGRMALRGLTPEQLFDSLVEATGYRERGNNQARQVFGGNNARAEFLARFASTEKRTETQTSILQALTLMNGRFISEATHLERSNTLAAITDALFLSDAEKVEALFLAALSRRPRSEEAEQLTSYVRNGGTTNDPRAALADVFWALLNSSEFRLNH